MQRLILDTGTPDTVIKLSDFINNISSGDRHPIIVLQYETHVSVWVENANYGRFMDLKTKNTNSLKEWKDFSNRFAALQQALEGNLKWEKTKIYVFENLEEFLTAAINNKWMV